MRKAYCDMCGAELHANPPGGWFTVYVDQPLGKKSLDFCEACLDKFWSLLDHLGKEADDAWPVVSCCDCKHFQVNVSPSGYLPQGVPEWECRHWCRPTDPTDFCSYGEKMEES